MRVYALLNMISNCRCFELNMWLYKDIEIILTNFIYRIVLQMTTKCWNESKKQCMNAKVCCLVEDSFIIHEWQFSCYHEYTKHLSALFSQPWGSYTFAFVSATPASSSFLHASWRFMSCRCWLHHRGIHSCSNFKFQLDLKFHSV